MSATTAPSPSRWSCGLATTHPIFDLRGHHDRDLSLAPSEYRENKTTRRRRVVRSSQEGAQACATWKRAILVASSSPPIIASRFARASPCDSDF